MPQLLFMQITGGTYYQIDQRLKEDLIRHLETHLKNILVPFWKYHVTPIDIVFFQKHNTGCLKRHN